MVVLRLLTGNFEMLYEFGGGPVHTDEKFILVPYPNVHERDLFCILGWYLKSVCLNEGAGTWLLTNKNVEPWKMSVILCRWRRFGYV